MEHLSSSNSMKNQHIFIILKWAQNIWVVVNDGADLFVCECNFILAYLQ